MHTPNKVPWTHRVTDRRFRGRARARAQAVRLVGRHVHLAQRREQEARAPLVGHVLLGRLGRVGGRGGRGVGGGGGSGGRRLRGVHHLLAVPEGGRAERVKHVLQAQVQGLEERHVRLLVPEAREEEAAVEAVVHAVHRAFVLGGVVARGELKV